jgi:predicted nucleotidyltransferase
MAEDMIPSELVEILSKSKKKRIPTDKESLGDETIIKYREMLKDKKYMNKAIEGIADKLIKEWKNEL